MTEAIAISPELHELIVVDGQETILDVLNGCDTVEDLLEECRELLAWDEAQAGK
jgi:hypothetical protein